MLPTHLEELREELSLLQCTLMNSYIRKYYLSTDRNYRATIDHSMTYYNINAVTSTFGRKVSDASNIIVELKYSFDNDDGAERVTNKFPFRMTKSSKYVQGLMHYL
jgi:hypothetical protein